MPARERAADRGSRLARADLSRVGGEIRDARVAAGLSQAVVGRGAGLSGSEVGRIERSNLRHASVDEIARVGAVVGLDIRLRTYPGPDPLRDAGQLKLLARLRARLAPGLVFRAEVPLPIHADQRAWDGWIAGLTNDHGTNLSLPVEVETRFTDAQAQVRRITLKMRDSGEPAVLLVIADTQRNRAAVAAAGDWLRDQFPIPARRAMAAIAAGAHPDGSAIVFL